MPLTHHAAARLQRERRNAAHLQRLAALSGNVWQRLALRQAQCKQEGAGWRKGWAGRGLGRKSKARRRLQPGLGQKRAMRFRCAAPSA